MTHPIPNAALDDRLGFLGRNEDRRMTELLERLVLEAEQCGHVKCERDSLKATLAEADHVLDRANEELNDFRRINDQAFKRIADLQKEAHAAHNNGQAAIFLLRDLTEAIRSVSSARRSRKAWTELAGKLIAADDYIEKHIPF